ncbi:NUDIX domain-containing protein [Acidovorax sp. 1608163]|uniref:NUDIX hydrolase n=1 Tax=Acidovorax sp. 1608163 TaxID=2478662 RepID=UPI000EF68A07|nr:NUDIX hydrolase [Acidovorax sp. 1608163]AYM96569.1 NUDIX domain-containing protein [Acidovorax sp. 1608163]
MLSFHTGSHQFHLRAACVAVHDGAVLLHRAQGDTFWALPGGRVEAGEEAAHAVVREMQEELCAEVKVLRLVWVVENFFEHQGKCHHEVGMYFLAELGEDSPLLADAGPFLGSEAGRPLEFAWFRMPDVAAVEVRPTFLASLLAEQDFAFRHVVHRDQKTQ